MPAEFTDDLQTQYEVARGGDTDEEGMTSSHTFI
jgi:hypothetical protein